MGVHTGGRGPHRGLNRGPPQRDQGSVRTGPTVAHRSAEEEGSVHGDSRTGVLRKRKGPVLRHKRDSIGAKIERSESEGSARGPPAEGSVRALDSMLDTDPALPKLGSARLLASAPTAATAVPKGRSTPSALAILRRMRSSAASS